MTQDGSQPSCNILRAFTKRSLCSRSLSPARSPILPITRLDSNLEYPENPMLRIEGR